MEVFEWHSPKELPPIRTPVICTLVDETETPWVQSMEYVFDQWLEIGGGAPHAEVLAWMPMPEPWTGPDFRDTEVDQPSEEG